MWVKLFLASSLLVGVAAQAGHNHDNCKVDLAFVVDHSSSICQSRPRVGDCNPDNWKTMREFLRKVANELNVRPDRARVGLVTFAFNAKTVFNLARYTDKPSLMTALNQIPYPYGQTNLTGGLRAMRQEIFNSVARGDRPDVQNVAIIITDGDPNIERAGLMAEVQANKRLGVRILTIGITREVNKALLESMVDYPKDEYHYVDQFDQLHTVLDRLVFRSCEVITTIAPTGHCLADIALLVDSSGSICHNQWPRCTPNNWALVKSFLQSIAQSLDIGPTRTRLGIISFANKATLDFDLDDYSTKQATERAIARIPYHDGNTNTTGAFRLMRTRMFTPQGGDRPDERNIAILITDGNPTRELAGLRAEVERNQNNGVRLVAVGVTKEVNETFLKSLLRSQDDYIPVEKFSLLAAKLATLLKQACRTVPPTTTVRTEPPPTGLCRSNADVTFILDSSGSISEANFTLEKQFAKALVGELDIPSRSRLGVVSFGAAVANQEPRTFRLDRYTTRTSAEQAIDRITYMNGRATNTGAALDYMRQRIFSNSGDRSNAKNVAVLFTDGGSQNKKATIEAANRAKAAGIHIITVGIGNRNWLDEWELRSIASWPYSRNYIYVRYYRDLQSIRRRLRELICDQVNECSSNPCLNGGVCVNGYGSYSCRCRSGYAGARCERTCRNGADVVFALDASGSIGRGDFMTEVNFARALVDGLNLNPDSRVGALTFADSSSIYFYLNTHKNKYAIMNAMNFHHTGGTTNTADALSRFRTDMFTSGRGDRSNVPNVGVVITDGRSNDESRTWAEAMRARASGINLVAVGVGNNVRKLELEGIATYPSERNIFRVNNFQSLTSISNNLLDAICNNNNECRSNPCRSGGRCIDGINGYTCRCPTGYTGINCERGCSGQADVIFVIDASGSIRRERFNEVLRFVNNIITQLEIASDRIRVGVIKFSDNPSIQFHLSRYNNKQDVQAHINHITFVGGRTNIASAIQQVRTQMLQSRNGARGNVPNFMIMFTDGNSNINVGRTIPEAVLAKNAGIHTIVACVGTMLNMLEINGIASIPQSKNVFRVQRYRELPGIVNNVVNAACDVNNECNSNPCTSGGRCINGLGQYICRCPRGRAGERCERACNRQIDVTFVLDLSGSVDDVTNIIIELTRRVIYGLDIDSGQVKVGLVSFMDRANINFYLSSFGTKQAVLNAVAFRLAGTRRTNTQEALRQMYSQVFQGNRGDRSGVRNYAIVITDGNSNIQQQNTAREAANARSRNIEIFSVGVGRNMNFNELNAISSDPDSRYSLRVPDAGSVNRVANDLLSRMCQ